MPELPAVGRGSGVIGRRVPVPGAFALASAVPGLVTGDDGDEVDSVLAVHLEIPVMRDDLLLCGNTKPTQLRSPGKINTRTIRTKRYCPAPGGTLARMTVLAHGSPHAGQTGRQHLRHPRSPAMTGLLLTGRFQVRVLAREPSSSFRSPVRYGSGNERATRRTTMRPASPADLRTPRRRIVIFGPNEQW
jgi:hypothetical protein